MGTWQIFANNKDRLAVRFTSDSVNANHALTGKLDLFAVITSKNKLQGALVIGWLVIWIEYKKLSDTYDTIMHDAYYDTYVSILVSSRTVTNVK